MKNISNPVEIRPSAAELRGAIRIPPPPPGSSKALQQEHHVLQARADALESDRGHAARPLSPRGAVAVVEATIRPVEGTGGESGGDVGFCEMRSQRSVRGFPVLMTVLP